MNSHTRRIEKRLEARLDARVDAKLAKVTSINATESSKESLPPHTEHKGLPALRVRARHYFGKTISQTKRLWSIVAVALALLGAYRILSPHVSLEPSVLLNPVDPYHTQFTIKNENSVLEVHNIQSVCWPRRMESGNGFSVMSPAPLQNVRHTIPSLNPNGSSTVDCPPVIGGIGTYAGEVLNAELEIDISYRQSLWPIAKKERYAFRAVTDVSKAVHWVHITPAEEKPIFTK